MKPEGSGLSSAPADDQTPLTRAASVVTVLALFGALYQFRLRQMAHEFYLRLDLMGQPVGAHRVGAAR